MAANYIAKNEYLGNGIINALRGVGSIKRLGGGHRLLTPRGVSTNKKYPGNVIQQVHTISKEMNNDDLKFA